MPSAQQQQNGFDAERLAALIARFDTGNPSEAEAMNAARSMRRMVSGAGFRFVDVMERADVKQALDAQLQPVRHASAELMEAQKIAEDLRLEVTERVRQVTELAVALKQEQEVSEGLRKRVAHATRSGRGTMQAAQASSDGELVNGGLVAVVVVIVAALLGLSVLR